MNDIKNQFLQSMEEKDTMFPFYKTYVSRLYLEGMRINNANDLVSMDLEEIKDVLIRSNPSGYRAVSGFIRALRDMMIWAAPEEKQRILQKFAQIQRDKILEGAREYNERQQKFISYNDYRAILNKISRWEDYNPEYVSALVASIYEGIYSTDMSVNRNLKWSDVNGNVVTLHADNGDSWNIQITDELKSMLKNVSAITSWYCRNGVTDYARRTIFGAAADSCFKLETRNTKNPERRARQKYINIVQSAGEIAGFPLRAQNVFISGIMHRIDKRLEECGKTLSYACSRRNVDKEVTQIFADELKYSHYNISVGHFREIVIGSIDDFL